MVALWWSVGNDSTTGCETSNAMAASHWMLPFHWMLLGAMCLKGLDRRSKNEKKLEVTQQNPGAIPNWGAGEE